MLRVTGERTTFASRHHSTRTWHVTWHVTCNLHVTCLYAMFLFFYTACLKKSMLLACYVACLHGMLGIGPKLDQTATCFLNIACSVACLKEHVRTPSPLTAATASTHLHAPRATPHPATHSTVITINLINLRLILINQV